MSDDRPAVHNDHHHDHHEERTEKNNKSDSKTECPHIHIHCTSICLGVLLSQNFTFDNSSVLLFRPGFRIENLRPQEFINFHDRPPIF